MGDTFLSSVVLAALAGGDLLCLGDLWWLGGLAGAGAGAGGGVLLRGFLWDHLQDHVGV